MKLTTRAPGSYTRTTAAQVARQQAVAASAAYRASLDHHLGPAAPHHHQGRRPSCGDTAARLGGSPSRLHHRHRSPNRGPPSGAKLGGREGGGSSPRQVAAFSFSPGQASPRQVGASLSPRLPRLPRVRVE
eukprot:136456-Prorocentrum_minimum.AAC.1